MNEDTVSMGWFSLVCIGLIVCLLGWIGAGSKSSRLSEAVDERDRAIQSIVEDANSKYNDLLESATNAKNSVNDQCSWLSVNISEGVSDYCYDAAGQFDESDYEESPIDSYDYTNFEHYVENE